MIEREIEAVLRAVPTFCDHGIPESACPAPERCIFGFPDYPAMARAVVERVVMPKNADCISAGCVEDRVHSLAKELGYMEELQAALADRDARLARVVEAAQALEDKLQAIPVLMWDEERRALRAALADAEAGK